MALFIDGFSCEVVPRQNPGEVTGICAEGFRFIYMTGSGKFTRLLQPGSLDSLIGEADAKIPMGYNQLWVFEKKFCTTPAVARAAHRFNEARREYPGDLSRHLWPGQLCVVLQAPEQASIGPMVRTYHTNLGEAVLYAQIQANQLHVRTLVGLMLADVTWH